VSSDRIAKITNGIVSWITKECRPISIVNDEGFVNIMKIATGCNTYTAPCYSTITEKMHHIYSEECKTLSSKLQAALAASLTADFGQALKIRRIWELLFISSKNGLYSLAY